MSDSKLNLCSTTLRWCADMLRAEAVADEKLAEIYGGANLKGIQQDFAAHAVAERLFSERFVDVADTIEDGDGADKE